MLIEKIIGIAYHRNGIGGRGFHLVDFVFNGEADGEGRHRLNAVYLMPHDKDGNMADQADVEGIFVTDPLDINNAWRGDRFADEIHAAVKAWREARWAETLETLRLRRLAKAEANA